ncbi:hypothetical protein [Streptomyces sp. H39-S7]|uniref:hypothetical protein n=1 Tax=Streptomyces sp. H39-S7 TaxID=3004357 RepID=UPI0022AF8621|nr:hypothetical protein [Streptomyces sp. H39-S7]MCZ4123045.1 hypothetical protein [Streptomyces sp. H39-S7]
MGTGDAGGSEPQDQAVGSSTTPETPTDSAGTQAAGSAGRKAGSKTPGKAASPSGKPTKASPSPDGTGSPSASGSAGPSSPAAPTTSASAVSKGCTGWAHKDPHPGTYGTSRGTYHVFSGPYAVCPEIAVAKSGAKVFYHCYILNAYGHTWTYVRIDGTKTVGWMSNDNLSKQTGPAYRC